MSGLSQNKIGCRKVDFVWNPDGKWRHISGMSIDNSPASDPAAADLAAARQVLTLESDSLRDLATSLGAEFTAALDILSAAEGKVVVSGMGKSGHIANKIAATLASTGTPAHSLHPGEASHGDLGMISRNDAMVLLSNSGETAELNDLLAYSRIQQIPMVAIVGRAKSTLGDSADVALILPSAPEACPLGLAPTTSTTMMLALGDALAVAMMERRGFSADQYHNLHPGGALGRRFLRVEDIMHSGDELPLVTPETAMSEAVLVMTEKRFGCVGIAEEGGPLIGIITDGDLRRNWSERLMRQPAREIMTTGPTTIHPQALAVEALGAMEEKTDRPILCLFVTEAERPIGLLHIHDIIRAGVT